MARPSIDLPAAEAIYGLADCEGRLAVRVTPGARSESLTIGDGLLQAKLRAAPEEGKANAALLALLAKALGVAPSRLHLLRGATSRDKLVVIPQQPD